MSTFLKPGFTIIYLLIIHMAVGQGDFTTIRIKLIKKIGFVEFEVNGRKAVFILDTGASISVLDEEQAVDYGIEYYPQNGEGKIHGLGGKNPFHIASVLNLKYDNDISFRHKFYTTDMDHLKAFLMRKKISILGILGADFFIKHKAIINYDEEYLMVCSSK